MRDIYLLRTVDSSVDILDKVLVPREVTLDTFTNDLLLKDDSGFIHTYHMDENFRRVISEMDLSPEISWSGTSLGVRPGGSSEPFNYIDLQGPEGPSGLGINDLFRYLKESEDYSPLISKLSSELQNEVEELTSSMSNLTKLKVEYGSRGLKVSDKSSGQVLLHITSDGKVHIKDIATTPSSLPNPVLVSYVVLQMDGTSSTPLKFTTYPSTSDTLGSLLAIPRLDNHDLIYLEYFSSKISSTHKVVLDSAEFSTSAEAKVLVSDLESGTVQVTYLPNMSYYLLVDAQKEYYTKVQFLRRGSQSPVLEVYALKSSRLKDLISEVYLELHRGKYDVVGVEDSEGLGYDLNTAVISGSLMEIYIKSDKSPITRNTSVYVSYDAEFDPSKLSSDKYVVECLNEVPQDYLRSEDKTVIQMNTTQDAQVRLKGDKGSGVIYDTRGYPESVVSYSTTHADGHKVIRIHITKLLNYNSKLVL